MWQPKKMDSCQLKCIIELLQTFKIVLNFPLIFLNGQCQTLLNIWKKLLQIYYTFQGLDSILKISEDTDCKEFELHNTNT